MIVLWKVRRILVSKSSISHGIRIWTFHLQAAVPILLTVLSIGLLYLGLFRIPGVEIKPIESLFSRFGEADIFLGQPMWAVVESGLFIGVACLFLFVALVEVISYVFFNMANPLKFMPRLEQNLGHYYVKKTGNDSKSVQSSKAVYFKNMFCYGMIFLAFFGTLFCIYRVLETINSNGLDVLKEGKETLSPIVAMFVSTAGLFFVLDLLYVLFMEISPSRNSVFEWMTGLKKVDGRK